MNCYSVSAKHEDQKWLLEKKLLYKLMEASKFKIPT